MEVGPRPCTVPPVYLRRQQQVVVLGGVEVVEVILLLVLRVVEHLLPLELQLEVVEVVDPYETLDQKKESFRRSLSHHPLLPVVVTLVEMLLNPLELCATTVVGIETMVEIQGTLGGLVAAVVAAADAIMDETMDGNVSVSVSVSVNGRENVSASVNDKGRGNMVEIV